MVNPGTINSISFAFKTDEPDLDMMIVLIQNPEINTADDDQYKVVGYKMYSLALN
jgi:hypothetical protein